MARALAARAPLARVIGAAAAAAIFASSCNALFGIEERPPKGPSTGSSGTLQGGGGQAGGGQGGVGGSVESDGFDIAWAYMVGGPGADEAVAIDVAPSGDVVLAGRYASTEDLDAAQGLLAAQLQDGFVLALDTSGVPRWGVQLGDDAAAVPDDQECRGVVATSAGSVAACWFRGVGSLQGMSMAALNTSADAIVFQLTVQGTLTWSTIIGGMNGERSRALTTRPDGSLVLAGIYNGALDIGGQMFSPIGPSDAFAADVDAMTGALSGGIVAGRPEHETISDAAALALNRFYCGETLPNGDIHIGDYGLTWAQTVYAGSAGRADACRSMVIAGGLVIAAGFYEGSIGLGAPAPYPDTGSRDGFIAAYDIAGNWQWSIRVAGAGSEAVLGVAADDNSGTIIAVGTTDETVDLGGGALTASDDGDMWIARFDALTGAHVSSKIFAGSGPQLPHAVALAPDGAAVVAGGAHGVTDFGEHRLTSAGDSDIFAVKIRVP